MQAKLALTVQAELKMSGIANIGMHNLSPGMVTTDLLMSGQYAQPVASSAIHASHCQPSSPLSALFWNSVLVSTLSLHGSRCVLSTLHMQQFTSKALVP